MSGIYMIKNLVNNKIYIGQSINLKIRMKSHFNQLRNNNHYNIHLQRSYNKYGENNFLFKIVENCSLDELNEKEEYWISYYDSMNSGYNQTSGGDSSFCVSQEAKERMKANHADVSGDKNPMYGKSLKDILSKEDIIKWGKNISKSNTGKKRKSKIKKPKKYKSIDENGNNTKIFCITTGETFLRIKDACIKYRIQSSSIIACCKNKTSYCGIDNNGEKLVWVYFDDYINFSDEEIKNKIEFIEFKLKSKTSSISKKIICKNTTEIFNSISDASRKYNIDLSSIAKCCKGKLEFAGIINGEKFKWEYHD